MQGTVGSPGFEFVVSQLYGGKSDVAGIWSFSARYRILHLTWFAFFLTFVVWFNFAPFATAVKADLGLTEGQLRTLAICNVAFTVPARIIVGMILDRFGPRLTYSCLLVALIAAFLNAFFLKEPEGSHEEEELELAVDRTIAIPPYGRRD